MFEVVAVSLVREYLARCHLSTPSSGLLLGRPTQPGTQLSTLTDHCHVNCRQLSNSLFLFFTTPINLSLQAKECMLSKETRQHLGNDIMLDTP